jgi:hypothetical protein
MSSINCHKKGGELEPCMHAHWTTHAPWEHMHTVSLRMRTRNLCTLELHAPALKQAHRSVQGAAPCSGCFGCLVRGCRDAACAQGIMLRRQALLHAPCLSFARSRPPLPLVRRARLLHWCHWTCRCEGSAAHTHGTDIRACGRLQSTLEVHAQFQWHPLHVSREQQMGRQRLASKQAPSGGLQLTVA